MKIKTIQKNIEDKLTEWLSTITDEELKTDLKNNLLVSGGCITSMLLNEPVNDYDVYLMNMDVCKRVADYYSKSHSDITILDGRNKTELVTKYNNDYEDDFLLGNPIDYKNSSYAISLRNLKENQIKLYFSAAQGGFKPSYPLSEEIIRYRPSYFSPNAISLSDNLQIVLRFWGTAEEIHKTFDFIHATNYFTFKNGLVRNLNAIESILTKQLKYQGSYYSVTSVIRAKKFIKRGFNINAGELLKIMFQISSLDLSNPDILEEQLIGVDVAYFDLLITALRNKMESDKDFKLSTEYFNKLIDKIFNDSSNED